MALLLDPERTSILKYNSSLRSRVGNHLLPKRTDYSTLYCSWDQLLWSEWAKEPPTSGVHLVRDRLKSSYKAVLTTFIKILQ